MIETWERCTKIIKNMGSLSGVHTWELVKEEQYVEGEGEVIVNVVRCHRCGKQPPMVHRARLLEEQEDFAAEGKESKRKRTLDTRNRRGS